MFSLRTTVLVVIGVLGTQVFQSSASDHMLIPVKGNCSSSQFQCTNGGCIQLNDVCDCYQHCSDGSDEKNCTDMMGFSYLQRHTYPLYCPNGKCISDYAICDGDDDCGDGSDEKNCTGRAPCNHLKFECSNGNCIDFEDVCDGYDNCEDLSDEMNCTGICNKFECGNGKCVSEWIKCNCKDDCGDGTDEKNCGDLTFHCPNGTCLRKSDICNCENDCGDGADEENCEGRTFHCSNGTCLLSSKICDCNDDCGDGADEKNCENVCREKEEADSKFVCHQGGKTLKKTDLNDGFVDCKDGSDENYCSDKPLDCANGECFQNSSLCENSYGCTNRSDGEKCIGSCQEFQCPGGGPCIHNNKICDCNDDCGDGADEKNCSAGVHVKRRKISSFYFDDDYKYHCGDGKCSSERLDLWTCTMGRQCRNYHDEMECLGKCDDFQCPSGRCISNFHQCDGINDCGDWSDEKNCPETACKENEFQCTSGECVLLNNLCNNGGSPRCRDGSDGENCDWRADLRCGDGNKKLNQIYNAQCNPFGKFPCCSDQGWCGNTEDHCTCPECVDYRACTDGSTYQTNNGTSICTCINGKYECKDKGCIEGSAKILDDGCNYCICNNKGTYEYCTERTYINNKLLNADEMETDVSTHQGELNEDP